VKKQTLYGEMYFLAIPGGTNTCWMIGRYTDQIKLATDLRNNVVAQDLMGEHQVRLGFRQTDVAPFNIDRQARYGSKIVGAHQNTNFVGQRKDMGGTPVKAGEAPTNRRSDREENVKLYWFSQTPQSHHVVEYNNLKKIGISKPSGSNEFDHGNLPCVLLAAEFHQRYISSVLKPTHSMNDKQLKEKMYAKYLSLYKQNQMLEPLWRVSEIILRHARVGS
jgi:hypothetical protein